MNSSLTQQLRLFARKPSQTLAAEIFAQLSQSAVYVPVHTESGGISPKNGAMGLKPDAIPGPEGKVIFPAFSDTTGVPNDYGARFSFLRLTFPEFAGAVLSDPRLGGVVLDPFTAKFMIPEEVCRTFFAIGREEQ